MSPSERSIAYWRKLGYDIGVVERFISQRKIRIDLFGFIDLIAMDDNETIGIQATGDGVSTRIKKILGEKQPKEGEIAAVRRRDQALRWVRAPGRRLIVQGWVKRKVKRGGVAFRYEPRTIEMTEANFE